MSTHRGPEDRKAWRRVLETALRYARQWDDCVDGRTTELDLAVSEEDLQKAAYEWAKRVTKEGA